MPDSELKADELEQLRRWGTGLRSDARAEVAAAGRAIELLIEEIERLHVLIWDRLLYPETAAEQSPDSVSAFDALLMRLRVVKRRSQSAPDPQQEPSSEAAFHRQSTDAREAGQS